VVKFRSASTAKHKVATYIALARRNCVVSSFEATTMRDAPPEARGLIFTEVAVAFSLRSAGRLCNPTTAT